MSLFPCRVRVRNLIYIVFKAQKHRINQIKDLIEKISYLLLMDLGRSAARSNDTKMVW